MRKQKEVRIKYDKQSMKMIRGTAIVATLLFAIGIALMFMEISNVEILVLFAIYLGGGLSIVCYAALVAGWFYRKRLEKYGYCFPEKKSDYGGKIENLPKLNHIEETSLFSENSKRCFRACIVLFVVFAVLDVRYYLQWKFMKENCTTLFGLCFFFYLIWILFALALKKQSNKEKYRDDVEPDTTRKERWSLEQILLTMTILCLLCIFANDTAYSMTNYIFNGLIDHDLVQADTVRKGVMCAITEYQKENAEENKTLTGQDTYATLCEGVDITTWGVPGDGLQALIAENLYVEDFSLMRDDFQLADGEARIFVKIDDGVVTVRLLNPAKEVSRYSRSNKEIYVESDYVSKYN